MNAQLNDRLRAAAIHLGFSIVLAAFFISLIFLVWYPSYLLFATGAVTIFLLMMGVDVVLGPLLTFCIFNRQKKSLKLDVAVIVVIQLIAFFYGIHAIYSARPVYLGFTGKMFQVVQANDVEEKDLREANVKLPNWGPIWTGTREADTKEDKERVMLSALIGGSYANFPKYHVALQNNSGDILKTAHSIEQLKLINSSRENEIDEWIRRQGLSSDAVAYHGLRAKNKNLTVFINATNGRVIDVASFIPWV